MSDQAGTQEIAVLNVQNFNGVNIYNLSSGKTMPQWLTDRKRRSLNKDEEYKRRIELLQDFDMPCSSQRVRVSNDGNFVMATGIYPPTVKVYDTRELSMKFERRLDAEITQFQILSEDYGKIAFLLSDRKIVLHAPYGMHYQVRVPKIGRDMLFSESAAELIVGGCTSDIYRLNLDQGRFMKSLVSCSPGVNVLHQSPVHNMLGCGGEDGVVECWDPRSSTSIGTVDVRKAITKGSGESVHNNVEISALQFDTEGLIMTAGTSSGHCMVYDLRSSKPLMVKEHQYGLPIKAIKYHSAAGKILSADAKVMKLWDKNSGEIFTNIETPCDLNDVQIVSDKRGQSGLLLCACEQTRCLSFYIPQLGHAPQWASFLDSITDELEETKESTVYDDYKFVTREQLESLALMHLLGTPLLKAYMHGFFIDHRLYARAEAVADPFRFDKWRKQKLQDKIKKKRDNRISIQRRLPKVNQAMAERILAEKHGKDVEVSDEAFANPVGDKRFAAMFKDENFDVDQDSHDWKLRHPSGEKQAGRAHHDNREEDMDSDEDTDHAVKGRFNQVDDGEEELEGRGSDVSSSDDEDGGYRRGEEKEKEKALAKKKKEKLKKKREKQKLGPEAPGPRATKMFELREGEVAPEIVGFGNAKDMATQKKRGKLNKTSMGDRLAAQKAVEKSEGFRSSNPVKKYGDREITFFPKSDSYGKKGKDDEGEEDSAPKRQKRGISSLGLANPLHWADKKEAEKKLKKGKK
jgi:ribosome biogenesis protein ENP2